jgi:hypothetical protein
MTWTRCGNTPYYRSPIPRGSIFANPITWSRIVVAAERADEWAGIATILYRKAPRYDWEAIKNGVDKSFPHEERLRILTATHEWFTDLMKAKETGMPLIEQNRLFRSAPPEARDLVLKGVGALINGYPEEAVETITLVAVGKNSPGYRDVADLRQVFEHAQKFIIDNTMDEAIDQALAYLGIHEC